MGSSDLVYRWRKSSYSGATGECVELGWRKSSHGGADSRCVELAHPGAVRDSKNPTGPKLTVALPLFLRQLKAGHFDR